MVILQVRLLCRHLCKLLLELLWAGRWDELLEVLLKVEVVKDNLCPVLARISMLFLSILSFHKVFALLWNLSWFWFLTLWSYWLGISTLTDLLTHEVGVHSGSYWFRYTRKSVSIILALLNRSNAIWNILHAPLSCFLRRPTEPYSIFPHVLIPFILPRINFIVYTFGCHRLKSATKNIESDMCCFSLLFIFSGF